MGLSGTPGSMVVWARTAEEVPRIMVVRRDEKYILTGPVFVGVVCLRELL
jgi:hypothetical protein